MIAPPAGRRPCSRCPPGSSCRRPCRSRPARRAFTVAGLTHASSVIAARQVQRGRIGDRHPRARAVETQRLAVLPAPPPRSRSPPSRCSRSPTHPPPSSPTPHQTQTPQPIPTWRPESSRPRSARTPAPPATSATIGCRASSARQPSQSVHIGSFTAPAPPECKG